MFFLRFIQFFLGSVRFTADGGYPEKFLTLTAHGGVMLWKIKRKGTALVATTLAKNYKKLRPYAAQSGVRLEVIKLSGLPFRLKKYKKRPGIFAGVLLFFALLWFFSSFVWTINITGNQMVSSAEITQALSDLGLRPGAFPLLLNVKEVERGALLKLPDLSWITVNITGSTATVQVRERVFPPDVVPEDMPCNIKAAETGQVIDIQAYDGKAMLKDGDSIEKGGLLISGVLTDINGSTRLVHASGKAIARTQKDITVTVPYKQHVLQDTGKTAVKRTLEAFNLQVPLYFRTPPENCRTTIATKRANVLGMNLPFALITRKYYAQRYADVVYSKTQAAGIAGKEFAAKEKTELAGIKILNKRTESKVDKNGYTLIGHYSCEEDIAYQEAIPLS